MVEGYGPMKPGNLFLQGAKSVGDIRKMRLKINALSDGDALKKFLRLFCEVFANAKVKL